MECTYLGIDLGTSSMKMVLTDSEKNILCQISEEYQAEQTQNGWSEIDPEIWFQAMQTGMEKIMDGRNRDALRGIGVTGQMHTLVVLGENGKPLRPYKRYYAGTERNYTTIPGGRLSFQDCFNRKSGSKFILAERK